MKEQTTFLKIPADICLSDIDKTKVQLTFHINNEKAVDAFLNQQQLIAFLKSPFCMDDSKSGARLTIEKKMGGGHPGPDTSRYLSAKADEMQLIIGRQIGSSTLKEAAWIDLLGALNTFIAPYSPGMNDSDWMDLMEGDKQEPYLQEKYIKNPESRGYPFAIAALEFKQQLDNETTSSITLK